VKGSLDEIVIERLSAQDHAQLAPLLEELYADEQEHYDHPRLTRDELRAQAGVPVPAGFRGESVVFAARSGTRLVGFCWCVLFDPGNGLEAEVAELFVEPDVRGQGVAGSLLKQAVSLFRERCVSFAQVWTRDDNPAALRVYDAAGFKRTEQVVLTWLPIEEKDSR
jgi:ribosomal protein S18 acetylase RimI-like enzyme